MDIPIKYIIAGILVFVALIIMIYFFFKKSINIENTYELFPMRALKCKISKTSKYNTFDVKYDINTTGAGLKLKDEKVIKEIYGETINKKAKISFTGKSNPLGDELTYIEYNDREDKYPGVYLKKNYNSFAHKGDIIINVSEKENINYKSKCIKNLNKKDCLSSKEECKWIGYICYDKNDNLSRNESIVFKKFIAPK
jgi:hypothetical protein